jgi:hypothetical protein
MPRGDIFLSSQVALVGRRLARRASAIPCRPFCGNPYNSVRGRPSPSIVHVGRSVLITWSPLMMMTLLTKKKKGAGIQ